MIETQSPRCGQAPSGVLAVIPVGLAGREFQLPGTRRLFFVLAAGETLRRCTLAEDPQLPILRRWVLAFTAWPGTDFRDATLTRADFAGAGMTYARLGRPADLTRTRIRGARDLHLAYVRGTILADRRVRELLVSGEGAGVKGDGDRS